MIKNLMKTIIFHLFFLTFIFIPLSPRAKLARSPACCCCDCGCCDLDLSIVFYLGFLRRLFNSSNFFLPLYP